MEPEPEPKPTPENVRLLRSHYSKPEPEPEPDTGLEFKKETNSEKTNSEKTVSSPLGRDIREHDKHLEGEIIEYEKFINENKEIIRKENLSETERLKLEDDNIFYNEKIKELNQQITELRQGRPRKSNDLQFTENIDSSGVREGTGAQPIPIPHKRRIRGQLKSKKSKNNKSKKRKHNKSKKRKYKKYTKKLRKKKQTKKRR
jgi:hypothetical protein